MSLQVPSLYMQAAESSNPEDRCQWLTYWLLLGFILSFDWLLRALLFFIPFYSLLRLFIVIALFYPKNGFALKIYKLGRELRSKYWPATSN